MRCGIWPPAKEAARRLAVLSTDEKNALLLAMADELGTRKKEILEANRRDVDAGKAAGLTGALLDRLELTDKRFAEMTEGVRQVARLPDPVGEVVRKWQRPNGLEIAKIRVPIGLIGIIYESRPNVTVDSAVLCLKTGNAVLLRGGREARHSNRALASALGEAARKKKLPAEVVSLVEDESRESIPEMCRLDGILDLLIPRGGHGLIQTVLEHARVPVIKHFHGVCHVFVHRAANPAMAEAIVVNSKCQRPATCNAAETLLVDRDGAEKILPRLVQALKAKGVKLFGDAAAAQAAGKRFPRRPTGRRNISISPWRSGWSTVSTGRWIIWPVTAATTPMPLSRRTERWQSGSCGRRTPPRSTGTPPHDSPMAASLVSGRRSVSARTRSTPGARWGWRS